MRHHPRPGETISPSLLRQIDEVCDQFEESWKAGQRPKIEGYLVSAAESERPAFLHELLSVELAYRRQSGETPSFEEYRLRFPADIKVLAEVFRDAKDGVKPSPRTVASSYATPDTEPGLARIKVAHHPQPAQPARLGRYRITGKLGQGGFGVVYKGYDDELRRDVAIKVPHRYSISEPGRIETYLAEGRILAGLDHPNIVPVHDLGRTDDALCFIVSKFIEGRDLATRIQAGRPSFVESAVLVATVADALHYAHRRGLVHRDIKPGNILLDKTGKAFVADFGLALKEEDFGKGSAQAGTPAYMSPEQARGEGHRVDGRSDLFSLGVVFYELLTGRRPLSGDSMEELLDRIATVEPRPPRQLDDTIPKELERICLKAICKRAAERYTTGKDMSEDLRCWLAEVGGQASMRAEVAKQSAPAAQGVPSSGGIATGSKATPTSPPVPDSEPAPKIIPKGLRSFDADDADFFLELLPGPRDRHGLPDGLRFWKSRIEQTDAQKTFRVGLLYGPSGCGKSSLVKAGLLPRLANHVTAVYVEATPEETEARLLKGLRKNCPHLPGDLGLIEALVALRRGRFLPGGDKVLLVLDQFEQWLHAKRGEQDTELVQALRQCDGERVQCIVMARDDFWMAATRFMDSLEIRLVQGGNTAAVDLFDPRHAKKVLTAFGRAFKALPERDKELTKEHEAFLEQAVAGLAREGKVISVRLALFAEMLKGRPWTPVTLRQVGGMAGVGVTFLEETFAASTAPPQHRLHQKAAQAVLKALLPQTGTDIKGQMRSRRDLLEASGYGNRPRDFEDLLRILDSELRLITPTDPEGASPEAQSAPPGNSEQYYQLTHDYLVPALRSWLTRKQKETRRGRAELRLAERATLWSTKPENRHLPAWWEWLNILLFTRKQEWTAAQQKMMTKATKYHGLQTVALVVMLGAAALVGLDIRRQVIEKNNATYAEGLVQTLLHADIEQVPSIVGKIEEYRTWTDPLLRQEVESPGDSTRKLHASLALLPVDPGQVNYLSERLLFDGEPPTEPQAITCIREALRDYKNKLVERLWSVVEQPGRERRQLQAACALAAYDPESPRWDKARTPVANQLVAENPLFLGAWRDAFRPVKDKLLGPLGKIFRDQRAERGPERTLAIIYLADYAQDQPEMLADLLLDADEKQFVALYPKVEAYGKRGLNILQRELRKEVPADAKEDAKETLAKRQANAAVALLRMGQPDEVWPLLRHSPDPRVRSYVIHRFSPLGADPKAVIHRLEEEKEISIRRALLLILGEFSVSDLPATEPEKLLSRLFDLYRQDPDPGLHGAVAWLLRQWGHKKELQKIEQSWPNYWLQGEKTADAVLGVSGAGLLASPLGHCPVLVAPALVATRLLAARVLIAERTEKVLEPIRQELANAPGTAKPRWFVNSQGQTLVVLPGPVEFTMGSPDTEAGRDPDEELRLQRIGHTFAITTTHVTRDQFKRCLPPYNHNEMFRCPESDCPVLGVSWYHAALYCTWLSYKEGLPQDQWCYLPNKKGAFLSGMQVAPNYLQRTGYRLPTEAEWEYACRAGAITSRYYGQCDELLEKYGWYAKNSAERTWPVGSLKPNDFGLFDMHGQLEVWCQDEYKEKRQVQGTRASEDREETGLVVDVVKRVLRGGSFTAPPANVRSAWLLGHLPPQRNSNVGFRVARTVRP